MYFLKFSMLIFGAFVTCSSFYYGEIKGKGGVVLMDSSSAYFPFLAIIPVIVGLYVASLKVNTERF